MDDEQIKEMIIAVIEEDRILKNYLKRICINYVKQIDNSREETMYMKQADTILKLQEQIRLLNFDATENNRTIRLLKDRYKSTRKTIIVAKEELESIKRNGNYEELDKVVKMFRDFNKEDD